MCLALMYSEDSCEDSCFDGCFFEESREDFIERMMRSAEPAEELLERAHYLIRKEAESSLSPTDFEHDPVDDLIPIKRTLAKKGLRFFSEEETKIYKLRTDAILQKKISRKRSEKQRSLRRSRTRDFLSQVREEF